MSTKLKVEVLRQLGGGGSLAQKPADTQEGKRARLSAKTTVRGVFTGCLTTGPRRGEEKKTVVHSFLDGLSKDALKWLDSDAWEKNNSSIHSSPQYVVIPKKKSSWPLISHN